MHYLLCIRTHFLKQCTRQPRSWVSTKLHQGNQEKVQNDRFWIWCSWHFNLHRYNFWMLVFKENSVISWVKKEVSGWFLVHEWGSAVDFYIPSQLYGQYWNQNA